MGETRRWVCAPPLEGRIKGVRLTRFEGDGLCSVEYLETTCLFEILKLLENATWEDT